VKGDKPPAPTRGIKPSEESAGGDEGNDEDDEAGEAGFIDLASLLPKTDIW